ncbi:MAG: L,D-transpeptidase [Beijerinckiaceae bacterium]
MTPVSRRRFLAAASVTALAGCAPQRVPVIARGPNIHPEYYAVYGPRPDEEFPLPAVDLSEVEPRFLRQEVEFSLSQPVGTIVVDPAERFLYYVHARGSAIRYGVGVGRAGYQFSGNAYVGRKARWPRWTPTPSMIADNPEKNGPWARGMEPGLENPLGARALYLYNNGRDTMYRIHGTNEPWSIGENVSSGCIRMFNQDVIDLYERAPTGTRVLVRGGAMSSRALS